MPKKIAAITMARNDAFFLGRWAAYYGRELGAENLYILLDGLDQDFEFPGANITKLPHRDLSRVLFDKHKSKSVSDLARDLFARGYDIVIGTDSDEFLIADSDKSLREYLSDIKIKTSVSGLGIDVGQNLNKESELNKSLPFLKQRGFGLLSTRYTKPVVISRPVCFGSGFHKINRHNFHINRNLYLFHFGSLDLEMLKAKNKNWGDFHLKNRARTIYRITNKRALPWRITKWARILQTFVRPVYAWNKPAMFGWAPVVKIPERFIKTGV
ncbi:MAG: glycosyltransferase family 2 protein [Rickettsiales bacterium]|jgi:hypothetical protein|nr:glycosyltransferase family 2 protein [Rickettsiales bacterium]